MKTSLIVLSILLIGCVNGKIAVKTGIEEVHFGGGGGFTGQVMSYSLSSDGKLTEYGKENGLSKKIALDITLDIFKQAQVIKTYSYNKPDNLYSFIEIQAKDTTNRIVWGFGSIKLDSRVAQLHTKLTSLIK